MKQRTLDGRLVEDVFPFSFQICSDTFKTSQALQNHYRVHRLPQGSVGHAAFERPGEAVGLLLGEEGVAPVSPQTSPTPCHEQETSSDVEIIEPSGGSALDGAKQAGTSCKLTKAGLPKMTTGAKKRPRVSPRRSLPVIWIVFCRGGEP